jgi:peptidoglycan/xylan/chitin deacetylase (PgdA/CDA1 family)
LLIFLKKKFFNIMMCGFFVCGLSLGTVQLAAHPRLEEWQRQNVVISQVKTDRKLVSLTFDDGPHPIHTAKISEILKNHDARATFFMTGQRAEKNPEIVQKVIADGHEIGNHSYSHVNYSHLDTEAQLYDFHKADKVITEITGYAPVLFRPPGGYLSTSMVEQCKSEGIKIAYWTYKQDSKDWRNGVKGDYIADFILQRVEPGQIIILHDGCSNSDETTLALTKLLPRLTAIGYQVVSMSELMKS